MYVGGVIVAMVVVVLVIVIRVMVVVGSGPCEEERERESLEETGVLELWVDELLTGGRIGCLFVKCVAFLDLCVSICLLGLLLFDLGHVL